MPVIYPVSISILFEAVEISSKISINAARGRSARARWVQALVTGERRVASLDALYFADLARS